MSGQELRPAGAQYNLNAQAAEARQRGTAWVLCSLLREYARVLVLGSTYMATQAWYPRGQRGMR